MKTQQCKKIVKSFLDGRGLTYTKVTARTVSFSDLARAQMVFVKVHGWKPNPQWSNLKELAIENGFRVEVI